MNTGAVTKVAALLFAQRSFQYDPVKEVLKKERLSLLITFRGADPDPIGL